MERQLILASSSPYRRELLSRLGLPFECVSPDIDESALKSETAEQLVARLGLEKARAVAFRHPEALIIASDQAALLNGTILGKPENHQAAVQQLSQASGNKVLFLTSLILFDAVSGKYQSDVIPFTVHFRKLRTAEIEGYLDKEQPYNCAGSFKSEGLGITLFSRLEGDDPNTLIGLPLIRLAEMLRNEGINLY